jgi:drug/metabolite transporter (DMT)-like permease
VGFFSRLPKEKPSSGQGDMTEETRNRIKSGIALMLAMSFMFASLDTLAKLMGRHYPTVELIWFRYTFHVVTMLLIGLPFLGFRLFRARNWNWQIGRGFILICSTTLSFVGLQLLPLAEFTAIAFITPLLVTLAAAQFLGEKVSRAQWVMVVLGFVGALVIIRPGSGIFGWAALIPLIMAGVYALFQVLTRKFAAHDDPVPTLFFSGLVGMVISSFAVPWVWKMPHAADWPPLIALGVMGAGGHLMLILAFRRAPASVIAPISYSQLVFAALLGLGVWRHVPDFFSLLGMAIILFAGVGAAALQAFKKS